MIKRINFIEKKAFSFTYLRLMQICIVVLALNIALVAVQVIRVKHFEKSNAQVKSKVVALQEKQKELTKQPSKKKIPVGQFQELFDRMQNIPRWAKLLESIGKNMPNSLWITTFKTVGQTTATAAKTEAPAKGFKTKDKQDKEAAKVVNVPKINTLEMSGLSHDMKSLTYFIKNLSELDYIKNVTVTNSTKEAFGYSFTIKGEVSASAR